jgi:hypothetical protein
MITQTQIDALRDIQGCGWITALRPEAINKLLAGGAIQRGLFDERNLFELTHPDFPGERLVACRNPDLAERRARKRTSMLEATSRELERISRMVSRSRVRGEEAIAKKFEKLQQRTKHGQLHGRDVIGVRVGKVVDKDKMSKHIVLHITDDSFTFEINQESVDAEAALDGIYVVRSGAAAKAMDADQAVRSYKMLSNVERAFRCLKSIDLLVRPIRHRLENRVKAHSFLCTLAYYVQWHMTEAWRPLLFADEDQQSKASRGPVAPAERSDAALKKVQSKQLDDRLRCCRPRGRGGRSARSSQMRSTSINLSAGGKTRIVSV